jgi:hypothetical protein
MWNEIVTLYIDDTSIRLLVSDGQTIKKWAEVKLEPGLIKGSIVLKEAEVTEKIKQLLVSQSIHTKKVILCFSGLHSLTRPASLPQLPKAMLAEAVVREARRVLPVPLDQLYLFWRVIPGAKGKISIYMAATPRKTVDSLVKVVNGAGLAPTRMAIKPLALTKLIPVNTAILVDLQPTEFDIAIMVDGVAQPMRTVSLPNEELNFEQKLDMIASDVDRTIKFFDTNNPETPLDAKVPIYISGELMGKPDFRSIISQKLNRTVIPLSPALKGPDQVDLERYSVNIAAAMRTANPGREATFPLADMNLLPIPYQPKPISLVKLLGIPGAIALVGLVVPMIMLMQSASNNITATQKQLDETNLQINKQTIERNNLKKQVTEIQNQANAVKASSDQFDLAVSYLDTRHEYLKGDLSVVLGKLSPALKLNSIALSENSLTLEGFAPNKQDVYAYAQEILQYARDLDSSGRYSQTIISSVNVQQPQQTSDPTIAPEGKILFSLTFERGAK